MKNVIRLDDCECSSESELLKAKVTAVKKMRCLRFHQLFHLCLMRWPMALNKLLKNDHIGIWNCSKFWHIFSFVCPKQSAKTMKQLYMTSFFVISGIIIFGGLIAPVVSASFIYVCPPCFFFFLQEPFSLWAVIKKVIDLSLDAAWTEIRAWWYILWRFYTDLALASSIEVLWRTYISIVNSVAVFSKVIWYIFVGFCSVR